MDCQLTAGCNKQLKLGSSTNFFQVENIEWKGILDTQADPAFESVFAIDVHNAAQGNSAIDMIVDQNYIHGWSILHDSTSSGQDTMAVLWATSADTHSLFWGNYISGLDSVNQGLGNAPHVFNMIYGAAAHNYQNYCEYTANCFIGAGWTSFHDNWFNFVYVSVDSATHSNAFESDGDCGSSAYNNIVSHIQTASFVQFQLQTNSGCTSYAFNNVFFDTPAGNGQQAFEGGGGGTAQFFNNTSQCGVLGSSTITCGRASGTTLGVYTNEHFITTANPPINGSSATITSKVQQTESVATGQGYTSTQTCGGIPCPYSPVSGTVATVGAGVNMTSTCNTIAALYAPAGVACKQGFDGAIVINSTNHTVSLANLPANARPSTGPWDAGAYEFVASGGGTASTPTCTANCGGTFTGSTTVTFANPNSGTTTMCYTTNGSTPVTNGSGTGCTTGTALNGTSGNVGVSTSETVKVVAGIAGGTDSSVLSETFTIGALAPTCTANCGGAYTSTVTSSFANGNSGTTGACYTFGSSPATPVTNGSGTACNTGTFVSGATFGISISATGTLKVVAGVAGNSDSSVLSESYTLSALAPSCAPSTGQSPTQVNVTCGNSNTGTTIMCYTEDASTPVTNGAGTGCTHGTSLAGSTNTIGITVSVTTLEVVAGIASGNDSSVVSYGKYKIAPIAASPGCNPGNGLYYSAQAVACTDSSGGSVMCYTTDGSTPATNGGTGCTNGTLYASSIAINNALTLEIVAGGTAYLDSPASSFVYSSPITHVTDALTDITGLSNAPTFTYTAVQAGDAVVFALECTPLTGSVSSIALAASGWTITPVGSPVSISNNSWAETFGAIAPNTSAATFTATFSGVTNCGTLAVAAVGEFSGNVTGGGTATFNAAGEFAAVSSTCNQTAANVVPPLDNEGIWFTCVDSSSGATLPYLTGASDGAGNTTGWKTLLGGATTPQTPAFASSSGNSLVLGVAINWGLHSASPGFVFTKVEYPQ